MSTQRFFPHRTAPGVIVLNIEADGINLEQSHDGSFRIYETDVQTFSLLTSAIIPDGTLSRVIAESEQGNAPVELRLVYRSLESRTRGMWQFSGDGTVFEGRISLNSQDWVGAVEVQAVLVRTSANHDIPSGFAAETGSILAWSAPVRLLFDQPNSPPGGSIEIIWQNFSEVDWPGPEASLHLFALDTRGPAPRLFLNSAVTGAYSTLTSGATHGARARVRDATNFMIVHQAWTSLLGSALITLAATSDAGQRTGPDIAEMYDGWQKNILFDWARYLFPGHDPEGAIEQLVNAAATPAGIEDVLGRIPTVIQTRFETYRGFEALVGELSAL